MVWLRVFEAWLTTRLLSSPAFHRAVQKVYHNARRLKDGQPIEWRGDSSLDRESPTVFKHFVDELKAQLRNEHNKKR